MGTWIIKSGVLMLLGLCSVSCKEPTDWERYAVLVKDCEAKLAAMDPCETGTPAKKQECWNARHEVQQQPPCRDSYAAYEKTLAAKHPGAIALLQEDCRSWEKNTDPGMGHLLKLCENAVAVGYENQLLDYWRDVQSKGMERLSAQRNFENRDPGGYQNAKWGSPVDMVAKEIVSNLKPAKYGMDSWQKVRQAAAGGGLGREEYLSLVANDGSYWDFFFSEKSGLSAYSQALKSKSLADVLVTCRELFGTPTSSIKDDQGREILFWGGPRTEVRCGPDPDGGIPWIFFRQVKATEDAAKTAIQTADNKKEPMDKGARGAVIQGRFVAVGKAPLITAITFDAEAMVATLESPLYAMMGGKMATPYVASSNKVYLRDPQKGDVPFKIQDADTIVCEMKLVGDVYKRAGTSVR